MSYSRCRSLRTSRKLRSPTTFSRGTPQWFCIKSSPFHLRERLPRHCYTSAHTHASAVTMFTTLFFVNVLLTLSVVAEPLPIRRAAVTELSFVKRVNSTGAKNLLKNDQSRAAFLKSRGRGKSGGKRSGAVGTSPVINEVCSCFR
jgi:hypothetical protein